MPSTPRFGIPLEPVHLTAEALATLEARECRIVSLRYGANGFKPHSLKEVADVVGMSKVWVSRIASDGARKLLALHERAGPIDTEIRLTNVPHSLFALNTDSTGTRRYRLTVDVVIEIGDRDGGYWALRGVGAPRLEEVRKR